ncbi:hypothetical protein N0824_01730 [Microcystis sp. 0824]|uniref:Uncharacterized protein n=3 Tax=Microcystis aeruginosa TaxID=1126 RepID=A0A0F6RN01_MICAE|nr:MULTISPECIES: hypothetical protein [Microcystis]AKE65708.1 hypothetical protein MYAER_3370 [Microcystis aeruginosa NIES-2549]AOC54112.1 hypothetical protein amyaer_3407 [Microcystis aeruginosa NIES-2481]GBF53873.1 hypothetical protein N0824_01730 [Microcystis sp. 0824]GCA80520.1 hypothetical protein MiTs_02529 [Microcystis aeruginosa NIES-2521]GCL55350.1 hypothetical protein NIES3806_26980 [Microcystis aeruginosa NIES-3806]
MWYRLGLVIYTQIVMRQSDREIIILAAVASLLAVVAEVVIAF